MNNLIDSMIAKIFPDNFSSPILKELFLSAQKGELCIPCAETAIFSPSLITYEKDDNPYPKTPLVMKNGRLYLQRNWTLETLILAQVKRLLKQTSPESDQKEAFLQSIISCKDRLSLSQIQAIEKGFEKSFCIFTGGPGTGKTYTAAHFIHFLANMHTQYKVAICAPTGKAASRLEEALFAKHSSKSLICKTSTLHRLLSISPGKHRIGTPKKLDFDLIVIDEASMLDHFLMLHLLEAVPDGCRLLLLGDANQLPPVESGSVFSELAHFLGFKLTQSHRMQSGALGETASFICDSDAEKMVGKLKKDGNWIHWPDLSMEMLADWLRPEGRTILTPLRRGVFGVDELNRELKRRLQWKSLPILIKQNDVKNQLWNGMSGVIIGKQAYFGDRSVSLGLLPPYEEAFCISIHKSQGSEYDEVLVLFPPGTETFGKEALYTAVTRAKKRVIVASTEETIRSALAIKERKCSGLLERLRL